jgi:hypothetical protein
MTMQQTNLVRQRWWGKWSDVLLGQDGKAPYADWENFLTHHGLWSVFPRSLADKVIELGTANGPQGIIDWYRSLDPSYTQTFSFMRVFALTLLTEGPKVRA